MCCVLGRVASLITQRAPPASRKEDLGKLVNGITTSSHNKILKWRSDVDLLQPRSRITCEKGNPRRSQVTARRCPRDVRVLARANVAPFRCVDRNYLLPYRTHSGRGRFTDGGAGLRTTAFGKDSNFISDSKYRPRDCDLVCVVKLVVCRRTTPQSRVNG